MILPILKIEAWILMIYSKQKKEMKMKLNKNIKLIKVYIPENYLKNSKKCKTVLIKLIKNLKIQKEIVLVDLENKNPQMCHYRPKK